jgi:alcohol dehydrogenase (cytochrome c)
MTRQVLLIAAFGLATGAFAQPPMPTDSWPTYNGDFSGRRFSPAAKINDRNVTSLSLAWTWKLNASGGSSSNIRSTPLMEDGTIYLSTEDNAWAVDARTGRELWHYIWPSKGGRHNGNKGLAMFGNFVYMETGDCHLLSIDKEDGQLKWSKPICDLDQYYFASTAPTVVGNHVVAGVSGDDSDVGGYLEAHDPETGELQWRFYTVPQKKGDPGMDSWPNADMASHGGGMTWQPITYDPETKMIYVTTGNPQPVIAFANRPGDNLYTCSIIALHADTGKMAWYFQNSPHDTHDWDGTEAAVLFDAPIDGKPRKLVAQAARNGNFFVLDRETGKAIVSKGFIHTNWTLGFNDKGQPIPNPEKNPSLAGTLVTPDAGGGTNWFPPSFSPQTGLFYVNANQSWSMFYLYDKTDNPQGWGGNQRTGWNVSALEAIDYKTGDIKWKHTWEGGSNSGLLTTAGNLIFSGAPNRSIEALNAATGEPLWHARLASGVSNAPTTWELDGTQYLIVGSGDTLYAFAMYAK